MKFLWLILLINFAQAATLSQYHSSPDGSSVQKFTVNSKNALYEKRSNFFDKEKSYSLGSFTLKASKISPEDLKRLDEILKKIKTVDDFLKKKNSSFNDLSDKTPHRSFLVLNDYRISHESDLYPELKMLFEKFQNMEWKQESGIKLSNDLKTITTIQAGKETKTEAFNMPFQCQKAEAPTMCAYKDLGILYVQ
ncbi:MAG: hypothetical protein NDI69_05995 [Bacteriovoracaceae bacterium]|nr:hypothetical protein [Bacteriovoracaceae bacterium]